MKCLYIYDTATGEILTEAIRASTPIVRFNGSCLMTGDKMHGTGVPGSIEVGDSVSVGTLSAWPEMPIFRMTKVKELGVDHVILEEGFPDGQTYDATGRVWKDGPPVAFSQEERAELLATAQANNPGKDLGFIKVRSKRKPINIQEWEVDTVAKTLVRKDDAEYE